MKDHMKLHTGQDLFRCEFCEKKFNIRPNWLRHMKIHTEESIYKCELCSKEFTLKDGLKRHMKIHKRTEDSEIHIKHV